MPKSDKPLSKVERLRHAGIITHDATLSGEVEQTLNKLTEDEVKALISIKQKFGERFIREYLCPETPKGLIL